MRPLDLVVLLKIIALDHWEWYMKDLAYSLGISQSEISESLNRSALSGLVHKEKKIVNNKALMEFLEFGLKYVFPVQTGPSSRGMPTAHSALPLSLLVKVSSPYVWPDASGKIYGRSVSPLHPGVPEACREDQRLYRLLALSDAVRVPGARYHETAVKELKRIIPVP
jgi:hypothetical protein